jgi:hypothetical protein
MLQPRKAAHFHSAGGPDGIEAGGIAGRQTGSGRQATVRIARLGDPRPALALTA